MRAFERDAAVTVLLVFCWTLQPSSVQSFEDYLPPNPEIPPAAHVPEGNICPPPSTMTTFIPDLSTQWITTTKVVIDLTTMQDTITKTATTVWPTDKMVYTTETIPIANPTIKPHTFTIQTERTIYTGGEIYPTVQPILLEPIVTKVKPKRITVINTIVEKIHSSKVYTADITSLSPSLIVETCTVASTLIKANEFTTSTLSATKYLVIEQTVETKPYTTTLTSIKYNIHTVTETLPGIRKFVTTTKTEPIRITFREYLQDTTTTEQLLMPSSIIAQRTCIHDPKTETITDRVPTVQFSDSLDTLLATKTMIRTRTVEITETSFSLQSDRIGSTKVSLKNDVVVMTVGEPLTIISAPTLIVTDITNLISYTLVDKVHLSSTCIDIPCNKEYNYQEIGHPIPY